MRLPSTRVDESREETTSRFRNEEIKQSPQGSVIGLSNVSSEGSISDEDFTNSRLKLLKDSQLGLSPLQSATHRKDSMELGASIISVNKSNSLSPSDSAQALKLTKV